MCLLNDILIVEDDTTLAEDLRVKLTHMGYSVIGVAKEGKEAIFLAERYQPDLILMDIILKGEMDGIEAASSINKLFKIPTVYLTSHSDSDIIERAKLTEPLGFILKPFSLETLNINLSLALYKAAEKRQRQEKNVLAATLLSLSEAIIVWDKEGLITYVNEAFESLYGAEKRDLLGQEISKLIRLFDYVTDKPLTYKLLYSLERDGRLSDQRDLNLVCKKGFLLPVRVSGNRVRGEQGQYLGYVLQIYDDIERKQQERALRESEARFQQLANHIESIFFLSDLRKNQIIYINHAYEIIYGKPISYALQSRSAFLNGISCSEQYKVQLILDNVLLNKAVTQSFIIERSDGKFRQIVARCYPIKEVTTDEVYRMACVLDDVTERNKIEDKLLQAGAVFDSTSEGIMVTDADLSIIAVNPAFEAITGYTEGEAIGQTPSFLKSGHHSPDFYQNLWAIIDQSGYWQGEVWNRHKNGDLYLQRMTVNGIPDSQGTTINYVAVISDITHIKKSQEKLDYLAHHDSLTGFANRLLFNATLEHAIKRADRDGNKIAVMMMDLDRFKEVNDSMGHTLGDDMLKMVAQRLANCVREEDTLARLGGDEFMLILQEISNIDHVIRVAEKITSAFSQPFLLGNQDVITTTSIGISIYPDNGEDVANLIKHADIAMYISKEQGRNRFSFYTEAFTKNNNVRLALATQMRLGLERGEFLLYYQPQVSLVTGEIIGAEALIRWQHPHQGLVMPMLFIPLAEETGFIDDLGSWVLYEACRQCKSWQDLGLPEITMAVNLSARQILFADMVAIVKGILEQTGLDSRYLDLELTESCIMQRPGQVMEMLDGLKSVAGSLSIDDFGTGYSSLSYLKRFPVDKLKIDRSFISDIPTDTQDIVITRAIIGLAKNLGLSVIAEGVETQEQQAFLLAEGCDEMQGYFFSKPLPAKEFEALLKQQSCH